MLDSTPVLIGAGQFTHRGDAAEAPVPLELLKIAVGRAAADAGLPAAALRQLDGVAVVGFSIDAPGALAELPIPRLSNPPASLARALGAAPHWSALTEMGGNAPQHLINTVCERISQGENQFVLLAGAEFLGAVMHRLKRNLTFEGYGDLAGDGDDGPPQRVGDSRAGSSAQETLHGLGQKRLQ